MLIHGFTDNDIHPPRFGGTQRTFGLYRGLARRHEVRVLSIVELRNRAAGETVADGVQILRRRAWYTAAAWRLEQARLAPQWLAAAGHAGRARALARELPGAPDVRAFDFALAGLMRLPGTGLRVYLAQNVEADMYAASAPRIAARGFWGARLAAFERRVADRADLVVAVSEEDAGRFQSLHGVAPGRLEVIPNGYDETRVRPATSAERAAARAALGLAADDYGCLFVGSDFPHNRDAAAFAVERVMPEAARHGARLILAGAVARRFAGRRESWLRAIPDAPDLLPLLHAADCGLNPVTRGGGSNVKIPTYLGAGLAALTSPFGLRGYPALRPLCVAVENHELAALLATRPRGWGREGGATPPAVAAHAWGALGEALGRAFEAALARGRTGGAHRRRSA